MISHIKNNHENSLKAAFHKATSKAFSYSHIFFDFIAYLQGCLTHPRKAKRYLSTPMLKLNLSVINYFP